MTTALIFISIIEAIIIFCFIVNSFSSYQLAKIIKKTENYVQGIEPGTSLTSYYFDVLIFIDKEIKSEKIDVSKEVYRKFSENDFITVKG